MKCQFCFKDNSQMITCIYCQKQMCKTCGKVYYHKCDGIDEYYKQLKTLLKDSFENKLK